MPEQFINRYVVIPPVLKTPKVQVIGAPRRVPSEPRHQQGYTRFESMFDYTGGWIGSG